MLQYNNVMRRRRRGAPTDVSERKTPQVAAPGQRLSTDGRGEGEITAAPRQAQDTAMGRLRDLLEEGGGGGGFKGI